MHINDLHDDYIDSIVYSAVLPASLRRFSLMLALIY